MQALLDGESLLQIGSGPYAAAWRAAHPNGRVTIVDGDARVPRLDGSYDVALLVNTLYPNGDFTCTQLCDVAARAVRVGGRVVVVETGYDGWRVREWLVRVGLVDVDERAAIVGTKPAEDAFARQLDSKLSRIGKRAWRELEAAGALRPGARPTRLRYPAPLRRMLAQNRDRADLQHRYTEELPRRRVAQIAGIAEAALLHAPLDWTRLAPPLDRLVALVGEAGVDAERALGFASAAELRAQTPTLAALYLRTHYGACLPFEPGNDVVGSIIHELCRFGRDREVLSMQLDEAITAWLASYVCPELPRSQLADPFVRRIGIAKIVRGQSGHTPWQHIVS